MNKLDCEIPFNIRIKFSVIFILQHMFSNSQLLSSLKKSNITSAIDCLIKKNKLNFEIVPIDRIANLSEIDFVSKYLNKNKPVIFSGAASDWDCVKKWNFAYLENELGDIVLPLYESTGLVEKDLDRTDGRTEPVIVEEILAKKFVQDLKKGEKKYLRFSLILENYPQLIKDFNNEWLKKMGKCFLGTGYQSFIGAKSRITPLHAGPTSFLYVMIDGTKKWSLYSANSSVLLQPATAGRVYNFTDVKIHDPDKIKYPGFELLSKHEFVLEKGDVLFVPAWMWHEVENLTDSWGMSYRFTSLRGFLRYPSFAFVRIFLTKPSFFSNFLDTFVFKKRTWAKLE